MSHKNNEADIKPWIKAFFTSLNLCHHFLNEWDFNEI